MIVDNFRMIFHIVHISWAVPCNYNFVNYIARKWLKVLKKNSLAKKLINERKNSLKYFWWVTCCRSSGLSQQRRDETFHPLQKSPIGFSYQKPCLFKNKQGSSCHVIFYSSSIDKINLRLRSSSLMIEWYQDDIFWACSSTWSCYNYKVSKGLLQRPLFCPAHTLSPKSVGRNTVVILTIVGVATLLSFSESSTFLL